MESYSAMMKRYRAEGLFPLSDGTSDNFLKEFLLPAKSRLRKSDAPLSAQQRLLLRHGFSLKHKFHNDYPTEVSNINTMTYGERLRAEQAERSRVAREAYIERGKKSAVAKAYQMRMRREFGIGRTPKSAMASMEVFASAQGPGAIKSMIATISKGIQSAFGGKELTRLAKVFGVSKGMMGAAGIVWLMKKYWDMSITAMRNGAQVSWASAYTGTTVDKMAGLTGALSAFGGSGDSAAKLYGMINQIKQGTLVGKQNPWEDAIKQYGLNLTTGGTNQWKSDEEIIKEISNRLAGLSPRAAADLAQSLHLDQSQFNLLRGGYSNFKSRVQYAKEGNPFADEDAALAYEYAAEQANLLGDEFSKLGSNIASSDFVTTITEYWKDVFHEINKFFGPDSKEEKKRKRDVSEAEFELEFARKQAGMAAQTFLGPAGSRQDSANRAYFEHILRSYKRDYLRKNIHSIPGYEGAGGDLWQNNFDYYLKQWDENKKSWREGYEHPPKDGGATVMPKISLNLGDIHLKAGGADAIRMAVVDNIDWGFAPTAIARV